MIAPDAVVTFEHVDGFRVVKSFGYAYGQATRPRNILRATFRSIGAFIGLAPIEHLTDAERSRTEKRGTAQRERAGDEVSPLHQFVAASSRFGSSVATYPLGARRRSACGHITIRPPIAMIIPPIQTHTTSGLKLMRSSAVSSRTPASTT